MRNTEFKFEFCISHFIHLQKGGKEHVKNVINLIIVVKGKVFVGK